MLRFPTHLLRFSTVHGSDLSAIIQAGVCGEEYGYSIWLACYGFIRYWTFVL